MAEIGKAMAIVGLVTGVGLVAAECVARVGLGLGTPPLYLRDPSIEYRLKPDQDVLRFGNRYQVNRYSMRSGNMDPLPRAGERRVMLFGDSVLNGGAQVDQSALASEILRESLAGSSTASVTVGNVSAFSWGPGNWLAYARRYGFFGSDTVIIVVNSGDWGDVPTFAPIDANTHPSQRPLSALWDGTVRYLPRYLPASIREFLTGAPAAAPSGTDAASQAVFQAELAAQRAASLADFRELLAMARATGARVGLVLHFRDVELEEADLPEGLQVLAHAATDAGVAVVSMREGLKAAGPGAYQDDIHLTAQGQVVLADALLASVSEVRLAAEARAHLAVLPPGSHQAPQKRD